MWSATSGVIEQPQWVPPAPIVYSISLSATSLEFYYDGTAYTNNYTTVTSSGAWSTYIESDPGGVITNYTRSGTTGQNCIITCSNSVYSYSTAIIRFEVGTARAYLTVNVGELIFSAYVDSAYDNGYISNEDESWAAVRSATGGIDVTTTGPYIVGVDYGGGSYFINRTFWTFDLTSLIGKTIVNAKIEVEIEASTGNSGFYAVIGTQGTTLGVGDFDSLNLIDYAMTDYTYHAAAGICGAYATISCHDAAELSLISARFGNRLSVAILHYNDINNISPGGPLDYTLFRSGECFANCVCQPTLTIAYR